ncbi:hypothetical protein [Cyclobacterium amurskyense]|uniref:Glycyl-tRNA synthetase n=1 Tax=Cyclobacterium amurskyense TaxID=320787 RepID=A0A0H4PDL7_9BACT|nr:hypothetical protein [Cyclobacterium amurskyense]AKP52531.1 Glycyl-tRNA synthetase [Cyclobacterium amurskyense]|tara:strand:+ start:11297 stop:11737 length:441 start_codon:yes stop_codon:yes gene_type:complete
MKTKLSITAIFAILLIFSAFKGNAQVHVGVYHGGILSHIGVGTDPEKKIFGEARVLAGGVINPFLGVEALGHYNFRQTDWYNLHGGLMLGYTEITDVQAGIPLGLSLKPITTHRQFSLLLEGGPIYANHFSFRALIGVRYTLSKEY